MNDIRKRVHSQKEKNVKKRGTWLTKRKKVFSSVPPPRSRR
jgi:hypothetical protein